MIYWDYNSTAPLHPVVRERLKAALDTPWMNPSSLHSAGQSTRAALDQARRSLSEALGAKPGEIVFTASATEANFLALTGLFFEAIKQDPSRRKIVISPFEHSSVFENSKLLVEKFDAELVLLPITDAGTIDLRRADEILKSAGIAFCSVIAAHNETGVIQPWMSVGEICQKYKVPFHSDMVQLVGRVPFQFSNAPLNAATVSFYKAGGPKGTGILYIRTGTTLEYVLRGGGQEKRRRAGTENLVSILGSEALCGFLKDLQKRFQTDVKAIRDDFEARLIKAFPDSKIVGQKTERLPNTTYVLFPRARADVVVVGLDLKGICVGTGSACSSGMMVPSRALLNLSYSHEEALQAVRFSMGPESEPSDVDAVMAALTPILNKRESQNLDSNSGNDRNIRFS